ncbi:MAG: hypothetical protein COZ75_01270 [Flavobacteriaceae bacterium CG_4_8_14_3_um_filter_34_10]|nr:hypothetical protein [Flavobacteriia bacterium]OIP49867.1 MAG: hypothetical protein AUK33_09400 [Flavobacteriaceae bacterium CG2_30_34_30]PIQ18845.1 MAG: hypothetical protein COW66_04275 [Flavobacteriaceae bacterium CG18_big_fil_WC_8_21_14_2_50_34_36]PIV50973.1 MAG: hypothetical protein COS19_02845 [Flavobacteriaceae bacterium CG02_land_8_20_14_3_00_34_13]PIX10517.1 MAG: hypothetical protein COZ75_01270 [Flavobacteriaceae bacterium CG_4_8_14_3_um_filter_34_10]PIZ07431.1 MAG: hypothetical pr
MNDAHLHLAINHFPIIGLTIGILVLLFGFLFKNNTIKLTALAIFIFSAITAIIANYTGEGAEEFIENIPGIGENFIETHEEAAEVFLIFMLILGGASLITFFLTIKKMNIAIYGYILVALLAISSALASINVGTSGGEIRHTEIRSDATTTLRQIPEDDD